MSFQAYIDNIKTKTGKSPEDFRKLAEKKGFLQKGEIKNGIKAGEIVGWLKTEFGLGMAMPWLFMQSLKELSKQNKDYSLFPIPPYRY